MYTVLFWENFKKRDNSTLIPTGSTTLIYDCDFLDGSGILSPTIKLRVSNPTEWNFAYIPNFKRYYKVMNWRYDIGLWIAELQVDVLASWAGEIEKQEVYVLRAASQFNGRINDTQYPLMARKTFGIGSLVEGSANPFSTEYNRGHFVVGIVNTDSGAIGAVSYYVFTPEQFKALSDKLMGDVGFYDVSDISDELTKVLANPFQYVVSCIWLPFEPPLGGEVTMLSIGWWSFNIPCRRLSGYSEWGATGPTIEVPKHPEALTRGYYLLAEPYSEYYLWFPPWGNFSIPADKLIDTDYITFSSRVDCITGKGELRVYTFDSNAAITVIKSQIGVPIELAQMAPQLNSIPQQLVATAPQIPEWADTAGKFLGLHINDSLNAVQNALNTDTGAKVANFAANIGTMMISKYCPSQSIGSNGSIMEGHVDPKLYAYFSYQTDIDAEEKGRPLCQRVKLGALSGFIQCGETDISIPCTQPENEAIRMYLASGIFLE